MGWKHLGIITLALCVNVLAQQGYNYDRPEKPFSGTSKQTPGTFPSGPTGIPSRTSGYTPTGEQASIPGRQYLDPLTKPGYPKPSQTLTSPNPYPGNQGINSYPSSKSSTAYEPGSSGSQQGQFGSFTPDYPSSKPTGSGSQSGYPSSGPSTPGYNEAGTSGSRIPPASGYPSSRPSTPGYNDAGTLGSQFPSGYPGSKPSGTQFPATSGYPSSKPSTPEAGTSGSQFPPTSGYPSSKQSGSQFPATSRYPSSRPPTPGYNKEGTSGSQFPQTSGYPTSRPSAPGLNEVGTTGSQFQPTSGYPSSKPSGPGSQSPATSGYPTSRPSAPAYNPQLPSRSQSTNAPSETGSFPSGNQQQFGQGPSGSGAPGFNGQFGSNRAGQPFPGSADSSAPDFNRPQNGQQFPGLQGSANGRQFGTPSFQQQYEDNSIDDGDYSAIPGEPGRDYSILSEVPETTFSCDQQEYPGYYADVETRCQAFHICANKKSYDFLCPNGTVFHQEHLVCVWWNQFDCDSAPSLYSINAKIYEEGLRAAERNRFASPQQLGENAVRYPTELGRPDAGQVPQGISTGRGGKGSTGFQPASNNGYDPTNQAPSRPGQSQFGNNGRFGGQDSQAYPRPGQLQFGNGKPGSQGTQGYPSGPGQQSSQFGNERPESQGPQNHQEYPRPGQSTSRFGNERPASQGYPSRPGQPTSQLGNEEPRSESPRGYPTPQFGNENQGYPSSRPDQSTRFGQGVQGSQGSQGYPRSGPSAPQSGNEISGNQGSQGYPSSGPDQSTKYGHGGRGNQDPQYPRPGQQLSGLDGAQPSNYPSSNRQPSDAYPTTLTPGQTQTSSSGQYPDHSTTGYPSGRPESSPGQNPFGSSRSQEGPRRTQFGGNNGQDTQGQTSPANKPTREYLPPVINK